MCLNAQRVEQGKGVRNEKSVLFEVAENAKVDSHGKDKNSLADKVLGLGGRRRMGGVSSSTPLAKAHRAVMEIKAKKCQFHQP